MLLRREETRVGLRAQPEARISHRTCRRIKTPTRRPFVVRTRRAAAARISCSAKQSTRAPRYATVFAALSPSLFRSPTPIQATPRRLSFLLVLRRDTENLSAIYNPGATLTQPQYKSRNIYSSNVRLSKWDKRTESTEPNSREHTNTNSAAPCVSPVYAQRTVWVSEQRNFAFPAAYFVSRLGYGRR